ncbi:HNH endonuclease [Chromobacterium haemolyticum]|uniref:HNH endonuclease n=1 Tax=Chromobacterium haemolyticum TaxID=394935 RepID=UPI0009DCB29D|nr:HNH endonuclease [Chromobacterium haemolyticum]
MAQIELTGKYAVGEHRFAMIDDDQHAFLSQWRWKAKPNGSGSGVYAVRNLLRDGRWVTLRMHREVLGLCGSDTRDVDHINHNPLDNRRINLRAVSRSENILNTRRLTVSAPCKHCGVEVEREVAAFHASTPLCCRSCKASLREEARKRR